MSAMYPEQGIVPYDAALKTYIDEGDAAASSGIPEQVAESVEGAVFGIEMGAAERTTSQAAAGTITALSVTVTGQGRPAVVEFFCSRVYHSVNGTDVEVAVILNGTTPVASASVRSYDTAVGREVYLQRRLVLTDGVDYTFTISLNSPATPTAWATVGRSMVLSVTGR